MSKSKKNDAALFEGLSSAASTPIQKVVPVKDEEDIVEQILFKVPGSFKKNIKIYVANNGLNITEFFVKAANEFIDNHPTQ
jgi:HSP20 family molecular chaperone IbpA